MDGKKGQHRQLSISDKMFFFLAYSIYPIYPIYPIYHISPPFILPVHQ
jgi:hypothetical protein